MMMSLNLFSLLTSKKESFHHYPISASTSLPRSLSFFFKKNKYISLKLMDDGLRGWPHASRSPTFAGGLGNNHIIGLNPFMMASWIFPVCFWYCSLLGFYCAPFLMFNRLPARHRVYLCLIGHSSIPEISFATICWSKLFGLWSPQIFYSGGQGPPFRWPDQYMQDYLIWISPLARWCGQ